jgi:hypothetical protein
MRINIFRVISVICSALLVVAVFFAFFASPYVGSAYLRVTRKLGSELPLITKHFSLAFLRNAENPFSDFSETKLWVGCLWFILFCWPIALMIWAVRAPDFEGSMAKWCLGMIAYLSMGVTVAVIVSTGLVMPFTGLK